MKLKHRFNEGHLQDAWAWNHLCFVCGRTQTAEGENVNAYHHIVSPSSSSYKNLPCNSSVLNSCPIHNDGCHLYNSDLRRPETEKLLLKKVLMVLSVNGYKWKQIDRDFIANYNQLYETNNPNNQEPCPRVTRTTEEVCDEG